MTTELSYAEDTAQFAMMSGTIYDMEFSEPE